MTGVIFNIFTLPFRDVRHRQEIRLKTGCEGREGSGHAARRHTARLWRTNRRRNRYKSGMRRASSTLHDTHLTVNKRNSPRSRQKKWWDGRSGGGGTGVTRTGVKDKSRRKWHHLIKVQQGKEKKTNKILNLSEWHCFEEDKKEKKTEGGWEKKHGSLLQITLLLFLP